jgi:hypothetical protein
MPQCPSPTFLSEIPSRPIGPIKLFDGDSLFLLVNPNGSRLWRFKYRIDGREKLISFGSYPEVTLKLTRERRDEARRQVAVGSDPSAQRQAERAARAEPFEAVALEWLQMQAKSLDPRTFQKKKERFQAFVFPYVGKKPIIDIKAQEILELLKRIEARGKHETTHRVRSDCGNVFRYAVVTSRADRDPTVDLRGAIAAVVKLNRPAIVDPAFSSAQPRISRSVATRKVAPRTQAQSSMAANRSLKRSWFARKSLRYLTSTISRLPSLHATE